MVKERAGAVSDGRPKEINNMRGIGKYRDFLELIGNVELPIEEISADMGMAKRNLPVYIERAENDGLEIKKIHKSWGLYAIQLLSPIKDVRAILDRA